MQEEDRIARGDRRLRHVAAQRGVDAVVRIELELGARARPPQPFRARTGLAARARAAEGFEVRARKNACDHLAADHVVGKRRAGRKPARMIERIAARIARDERRRQLPVGAPVPIGQREIGFAGKLADDAFEVRDIGAMPRQEIPVAVRTEIAMHVGEAVPVARIGRRQRLHRGDRSAQREQVRIAGAEAADRTAGDRDTLRRRAPAGREQRDARNARGQNGPSGEHEILAPIGSSIETSDESNAVRSGVSVHHYRRWLAPMVKSGGAQTPLKTASETPLGGAKPQRGIGCSAPPAGLTFASTQEKRAGNMRPEPCVQGGCRCRPLERA